MVIPVTETEGLTYNNGKAIVVKDFNIHDTCTIEHLEGMDLDDPNGEGCLDLACHYCNTTRGNASNTIKPYIETPQSPFQEQLSGLREKKID